MQLGGAVEGERRVVLLGDVARLLDPHHVHRVALDVHAEDVPGVVARLGGVGGELDAAGLAPASHLHLRLHHDRVAELVGRLDRLLHGVGRRSRRHGDPVAREELLALVLEQIHPRSPLSVVVDWRGNGGRSAAAFTNRRRKPRPDWTFPVVRPYTVRMAPARDDLPIIVVASLAVVVAGVLVALVLLLATGRGGSPTKYQPFEAGAARSIREQLKDGGPYYVPDPFGGNTQHPVRARGRPRRRAVERGPRHEGLHRERSRTKASPSSTATATVSRPTSSPASRRRRG